MIRILLFSIFLVFVSQWGIAQEDGEIKWENGKKYQYHLVKPKETLYGISKQYNVKVNDILLYNTEALDGLREGIMLKIPLFAVTKKDAKEVVELHDDELIYIVEAGQTIYSICKEYDVTEEALRERNPELLGGLKVGMKLVVPIKIESLVNDVADYSSEKSFEITDTIPDTLLRDSNVVEVALLLPFFFDQNDTLNKYEFLDNKPLSLPKNADISMSYFLGVKMALDSLTKLGVTSSVKVFDTAGDSLVMKKLLAENDFNEYDLVIGPAYKYNLELLCQQINQPATAIVSPFYHKEDVLTWNKQMVKLSPNPNAEMDEVQKYLQRDHLNSNVIFLYESTQKDDYMRAKDLEQAFNTYRLTYGDSVKTLAASVNYRANGIDGLVGYLDAFQENVLVVPSSDEAFITRLFIQLNPALEDFQFRVIGMDNWKGFSSFEPFYFELYKVHFPSTGGVDYTRESVQHFVKDYYKIIKNEPNDFTFQAFDVAFYIGKNIYEHKGYKHSYLVGQFYEGMFFQFYFKYTTADQGVENHQTYMVRFKDYQIQTISNHE